MQSRSFDMAKKKKRTRARRRAKPVTHPNASRKLLRLLRQVKRETGEWNIREVARCLEINVKYVHENLMKGIIPSNRTIQNVIGVRAPKPPRPVTTCALCGRTVYAKKNGKPVAHARADGTSCEECPKPAWLVRWRALPPVKRNKIIEYMMTVEYVRLMKMTREP